jgi:hypothetical protein
MIETLTAIGVALLFGIGLSMTVLGLTLFYKVYISSQNYDSPLVILLIAFFSLWFGTSCLFFVIA